MVAATDNQKMKARRKKGFEATSGLLQSRIREAVEARGFSESRLLTHWSEVVGDDTAAMARPVKVSYAQGGFGATLTLLTTGAFAPLLQAQLPQIRERVNAVYGYNAIARIKVTQTAPTGFSEGRVSFETKQRDDGFEVDPKAAEQAHKMTETVTDEGLRKALETLGANLITKRTKDKR
ncbi:DUF721 domain-containing protein [Celeribacter sp.]|uniref:DUF721 domain-containing protein n=1 Tax=Celeribacter sp. TaxID=1890673 RepID=UPI003A935982